jgi:hypothetical protein
MSLLKTSGIISDHLANTPVAGISFGVQPMGVQPIGMNVGMTPFGPTGMGVGLRDSMGNNFGMINGIGIGRNMGALGGLTPVRFKNGLGNLTVTHPVGMPIATSFDPLNPYNTLVSNPWDSLSSDLAALDPIVKKEYNDKGVNVIIAGNNSVVNKVIDCLNAHLTTSSSSTAKVDARSPAPAPPAPAGPPMPLPPFLPGAPAPSPPTPVI